jgi:hypothetical protein
MTISLLKPKRSAGGGFFIVYRGETYLYITEMYHLYFRDDDTPKDRYHLKRDRYEFINSQDTLKLKVDGCTYIMQFMYDCDEEHKRKVIEKYHKGEVERVALND